MVRFFTGFFELSNYLTASPFQNILKFWLDKGVDGFRIDSVMFMYEDAAFPDEQIISDDSLNGYPRYAAMNHSATTNQPETFEIIAEFRHLLDSYKEKDGYPRFECFFNVAAKLHGKDRISRY